MNATSGTKLRAAGIALLLATMLMVDVAKAGAQTVFRFTGSAGQVGKSLPPAGQPGGAPVNIQGRFAYDGAIDLCAATLTLTDVLADAGAGELVRGTDAHPVLPVVIENPQCSSSGDAVFRSPDSERPTFRVAVRQRPDGFFDFHIKISRANIPTPPESCSGDSGVAELATSLVLDDGLNPALAIATVEEWQCKRLALRASRNSGPPGPTPTPTPVPTASPVPTLSPVPTPSPMPTFEEGVASDFTGHATHVDEIGVPIEAAQIRISGRFCAAALVDLSIASVAIQSVLGEESGAGELLAGLPLALDVEGPTADGFAYRCNGPGPSCWMEAKQTIACTLPGGATGTRYEYNLKIDRSEDSRRVPITYQAAPSCSAGGSTALVTDFAIEAAGVTVRMQTEQSWGCSGDGGVSELGAPD